MIKHIVMWKLKEEAERNNKKVNTSIIKNKLNALVPVIQEILSLEIGENFNPTEAAYDVVLITTHNDRDGLAGYVNHPAHQEAASFIGKVVAERKVVDFEV